jgi:hypothetical protein
VIFHIQILKTTHYKKYSSSLCPFIAFWFILCHGLNVVVFQGCWSSVWQCWGAETSREVIRSLKRLSLFLWDPLLVLRKWSLYTNMSVPTHISFSFCSLIWCLPLTCISIVCDAIHFEVPLEPSPCHHHKLEPTKQWVKQTSFLCKVTNLGYFVTIVKTRLIVLLFL